MRRDDGVHLLELFLFELAAVGLHFAQLFQSLQQAPRQALFIDRQRGDWIFGAAQRIGEGERGVRFGIAGVPVVSIFLVADSEQVVFGSSHAVQPELEIGAGMRELNFYYADWIERGGVLGGELVVGGHFFFGEKDDLREDSVPRGVERRALFAFGRARAGGSFGVLAVGPQACFGEGAFGFGV